MHSEISFLWSHFVSKPKISSLHFQNEQIIPTNFQRKLWDIIKKKNLPKRKIGVTFKWDFFTSCSSKRKMFNAPSFWSIHIQYFFAACFYFCFSFIRPFKLFYVRDIWPNGHPSDGTTMEISCVWIDSECWLRSSKKKTNTILWRTQWMNNELFHKILQ